MHIGNKLFEYGRSLYGDNDFWQKWGHHIYQDFLVFHAVGTVGEHALQHKAYTEGDVDHFALDRGRIRSEFEAKIPEAIAKSQQAELQHQQNKRLATLKLLLTDPRAVLAIKDAIDALHSNETATTGGAL